jgi:hypothetical protein
MTPKKKIDPLYYERDPEILLGDRRHPKGWKSMTDAEKLEYIATRSLAEDREGTTSHTEIKDSGILSVSQQERRKNREVFSEFGDLDAKKPIQGVFGRVHVRDIRGVRNPEKNSKKESK